MVISLTQFLNIFMGTRIQVSGSSLKCFFFSYHAALTIIQKWKQLLICTLGFVCFNFILYFCSFFLNKVVFHKHVSVLDLKLSIDCISILSDKCYSYSITLLDVFFGLVNFRYYYTLSNLMFSLKETEHRFCKAGEKLILNC